MPDLPIGTVTFLFTDLEGSTRLWERPPDQMRAALVRHDALVEGLVAEPAPPFAERVRAVVERH
jgi:class 3 adenylate cyclase